MNVTTEQSGAVSIVRVAETRLMYPILSDFSAAVTGLLAAGRREILIDLTPVIKCVFFGYTYRWVCSRDDVGALPAEPWWGDLTPVQQQLLGGTGQGSRGNGDGDHAWGHHPEDTPLYVELRGRGLLDRSHPPLIP